MSACMVDVMQARLERAALFYTQQKADQFPALLLRMEIRAQVASQEAQAAVKPLYAELQRKGLTMTEVGVVFSACTCMPSPGHLSFNA